MSKNATPSPADYKITPNPTGPSYSIQGKDKSKSKNESPTPGPSDYYPSSDLSLERFPSVRIGRSKRNFIIKDQRNPGPGSYSMDLSMYSGPKWRFGGSKRRTFAVNDTPGPGMYTVSAPKSSIAYSISPSKYRIKPSITPGPGAYSPSKAEGSPKAVIGTSKRETASPEPTPGPGAYNPEIRRSQQGTVCNN